jgi:hypothetical protein
MDDIDHLNLLSQPFPDVKEGEVYYPYLYDAVKGKGINDDEQERVQQGPYDSKAGPFITCPEVP